MNVGDKITHPSHGDEIGVVSMVWSDDTFLIRFLDGEYQFKSGFTVVEKAIVPKKITPRAGHLGGRKSRFKMPSQNALLRLKGILNTDPNLAMSISVPPVNEEEVLEEQGREGVTVASEQKDWTSYDTKLSTNSEVTEILKDSGAYLAPYRGSTTLSLIHGARKDFYMLLISLGFKPLQEKNNEVLQIGEVETPVERGELESSS